MAAVVSLKNVVKRYTRGKQQVEVLHALDLEVESGDFPISTDSIGEPPNNRSTSRTDLEAVPALGHTEGIHQTLGRRVVDFFEIPETNRLVGKVGVLSEVLVTGRHSEHPLSAPLRPSDVIDLQHQESVSLDSTPTCQSADRRGASTVRSPYR